LASAEAATVAPACVASAAAAAAGPAITSEERVEERMAFKMLFYKVQCRLAGLLSKITLFEHA
jgi:hypothetical protein